MWGIRNSTGWLGIAQARQNLGFGEVQGLEGHSGEGTEVVAGGQQGWQ